MSAKLPHISGLDVVRRLKRAGFVAVRQRGSHVRMEKSDPDKVIKLTIPMHPELKIGTLHRIITDAGLTPEEYERLA